jgi:hypothetical protein
MVLTTKETQNISSMKEQTKDYFYKLGGNRESINKVGRANNINEIIKIFVDWYYNQFLYHHKEQFFDMVAFCETYKASGFDDYNQLNSEISKRLEGYFSLSILEVSKDEAMFNNLSLKNIVDVMLTPIEFNTVSNIERLLANKYSKKLDFALFVYALLNQKECEMTRLRRVLANISPQMFNEFLEVMPTVYEKYSYHDKFFVLKEIENVMREDSNGFHKYVDILFNHVKADHLYYGIVANKMNPLFEGEISC